MPASLTRQQRHVLALIEAHCNGSGEPLTLESLCRMAGVSSRGSMHKHVQALVEAGLVEPAHGLRRGLRPVAADGGVPLLGRIAAGRPLEAVREDERIEVPAALLPRGPCYVLEVRGDSMIEEGILDGDRVVVAQRDHAPDGALVVALVDGTEATLKRIEQRPGVVVLRPANPAYAPMSFSPDRVVIQGEVVGLMRRYQPEGRAQAGVRSRPASSKRLRGAT